MDDFIELLRAHEVRVVVDVRTIPKSRHNPQFNQEDLKQSLRHTTMHTCIQGWSAVVRWTGVPLATFVERCRPLPGARYVVFHAFDDKGLTDPAHGTGHYYEVLDLDLALMPQAMLAYGMNGGPLPVEHGAPLRLRVENQLGFKMVKWIARIDFVADYAAIGEGHGRWRDDNMYYGNVVGI